MLRKTQLYTDINKIQQMLNGFDLSKKILIQIFTSTLDKNSSLALAQQITQLCPSAMIMGCSVSAMVCNGEQIDDGTMIVAEQFETANPAVMLLDWSKHTTNQIVDEIKNNCNLDFMKVLRVFFGGFYGDTHHFVDQINQEIPNLKLAGGLAGEVGKNIPFVFDHSQAIEQGCIMCGISGAALYAYSNANTAQEKIGPVYTITKTNQFEVVEIDGQAGVEWIESTLGFVSTETYDTWEEITQNDPLARFQFNLEGYTGSSRNLYCEQGKLKLFTTKPVEGAKFRISYSSPSRCVEECKAICADIQTKPVEQIFFYSCLYRKLYLQNCAKWEIEPLQQNDVAGVFLLGEIGYFNGKNEHFNGTCVLSGIAEKESYIKVDDDTLKNLEEIQQQNNDLLEFVMCNQARSDSSTELMDDVIKREKSYSNYLYIDPDLDIPNVMKFDEDRSVYDFDKLCLVKIDNAELLIGYLGRSGYFEELKRLIDEMKEHLNVKYGTLDTVHLYAASYDAFLVANNSEVSYENFAEHIAMLEEYIKIWRVQAGNTPFILRFVLVKETQFLLQEAYSKLQSSATTQEKYLYNDTNTEENDAVKQEIKTIEIINYALKNGTVVPYYQGIYNNKTESIDKYEALMRLIDHEGNVIAPLTFMEIAKKYRLYLELNLKMFQEVVKDLDKINGTVSINLSAHDIGNELFRDTLREQLAVLKNPENLIFEILEDEYFKEEEILLEFINEVRSYGVKVAIDDFGTGYSNLLEIIKIRPDYLKIDGKIIREVHKNIESKTILELVTVLSEKMEFELIAEFVENEQIQEIIKKNNTTYSQGYLFAKPLPVEEIIALKNK